MSVFAACCNGGLWLQVCRAAEALAPHAQCFHMAYRCAGSWALTCPTAPLTVAPSATSSARPTGHKEPGEAMVPPVDTSTCPQSGRENANSSNGPPAGEGGNLKQSAQLLGVVGTESRVTMPGTASQAKVCPVATLIVGQLSNTWVTCTLQLVRAEKVHMHGCPAISSGPATWGHYFALARILAIQSSRQTLPGGAEKGSTNGWDCGMHSRRSSHIWQRFNVLATHLECLEIALG
jgi:hypothetical protein